jgi:hypothetical protein
MRERRKVSAKRIFFIGKRGLGLFGDGLQGEVRVF